MTIAIFEINHYSTKKVLTNLQTKKLGVQDGNVLAVAAVSPPFLLHFLAVHDKSKCHAKSQFCNSIFSKVSGLITKSEYI